MRKLSLAAAVAALCAVPALSFADIYDARSMGRAGAGLTMGEYNQAILNPALINHFDENDDFSFALNAGVFASDKDGMLEATDDAQDAIDALENNPAPTISDVNNVDAQLQALNGKIVQVDAGTSMLIAIPNGSLPGALVVKGKLSFGTVFNYDGTDQVILAGIAAGTNTQNDLQSNIRASAVAVTEAGLMFGKKLENGLELGGALKGQKIELLTYTANAANFDAGDINDSNNSTDHSNMNIDLGANLRFGANNEYVFATTIENLIPKSFDGPASTGVQYKMEPLLTTGIGYGNTWFKGEANVDLTVRNGYDLLADTQFARLGLEFSAGRHFHVRTGYRADLKNNVSDVFTIGFGITPYDRFNLDLSAMTGEGDTLGVALQVGFKI